jgi:hypothetical protein
MRPMLERPTPRIRARWRVMAGAACVLAPCLLACAGLQPDPYRATSAWSPHLHPRGGPEGADLAGAQLRSDVCAGQDLRPDHARLSEADLVQFLQVRDTNVTVERPRGDLAYVSLPGLDGERLRLRVAVLSTPDEAGRELALAIAQHGKGSWGVHRSNLAVLGPARAAGQVIELVSKTKLACWGVLTLGSGEDVYVIPGGYREL